MKRLFSLGVLVLGLTLVSEGPASANPGQVSDPPPATDDVFPGKACDRGNLGNNRGFDSNHATGVSGGGTPPTCVGGGG